MLESCQTSVFKADRECAPQSLHLFVVLWWLESRSWRICGKPAALVHVTATVFVQAIVAEWLATLACRDVHDMHTANIVTTLATPDFSMPYVVCSLTSSLVAIFAGLFFTLLTERRRSVALRQLRRSSSKMTKLKPLIILALFLVLVPYMDTEWRDWVVAQLQGAGVSWGVLEAIGLVAAV